MQSLLWVVFALLSPLLCCLPQHVKGARVAVPDGEGPGEPLFLTPYIEQGNIAEARRLARVTLSDLQMESYSGFFTVSKAYNSNQFFWYFPSMSTDKDKAPALIWLNGGPGSSSLFGLFIENGPIQVVNGKFERRQIHWALNHHLIYIDNPVGTGFSFTNDTKGYCTDETQVGEQLYSTLTQFFQLFPELQQNDFFITGESYAGKYVPALAYTIMKNEATTKTKVNLKGLVIGGAWINPDSQKEFSLHHACRHMDEKPKEMWIMKSLTKEEDEDDKYISVLNKDTVRKAIHVGNLSFNDSSDIVYKYMHIDFCRSIAPWLSEILDHYPVTLYGGQNDKIVPYAGIADFLRNHFKWSGADDYKAAKRYSWRVDGELAGCVRRARLLTDIFVLNATHFVPADQPKRALDMITRITQGKGFDQIENCTIKS